MIRFILPRALFLERNMYTTRILTPSHITWTERTPFDDAYCAPVREREKESDEKNKKKKKNARARYTIGRPRPDTPTHSCAYQKHAGP